MRRWTHPMLASCFAAAALAAARSTPAYPSRPIKWIVPYTPGGITDTVTRIVAQKLAGRARPADRDREQARRQQHRRRRPRREERRRTATRSLTVIAAHAANATLYAGKLPFDPVKSFAPVSLVAVAPLILTVNNDFPGEGREGAHRLRARESRQDLVRLERHRRGGAPHHRAPQADRGHRHGARPVQGHRARAHRRSSPATSRCWCDVPSSLMPHVRAGKIRALGMFSRRSASPAPPRCRRSPRRGGPAARGLDVGAVPRARGHAARGRDAPLHRDREDPRRRRRCASASSSSASSRSAPRPSEAARFLDDEIAKWAKVITTAGVKAEQ